MAGLNDLLLTFYGDDLTGSTDALEALELGGIPTILFLEPPEPGDLDRYEDIQAVGLAGISRTMRPHEMEAALPDAFTSLKNLGAPLAHYKVCSTFDSAPEIGSIGKAGEIGQQVFGTALVPVMVGAPKLKRFVVFGNHFASVGDQTYRLDRHPTMSRHPITPMHESDLRLHLEKQTDREIGLVDLRHLAEPDGDVLARLDAMKAAGIEFAILDTLDRVHQGKVGGLLWALGEQEPTFVVGSSGVEFALADYWQSAGIVKPPGRFVSPGPVDQVVAVSGSAAPLAASQIQEAFERGFAGIRLDTIGLVDPQSADTARKQMIDKALDILEEGRSLILYSALGPDDPKISETKAHLSSLGAPPGEVAEILGTQQGLILKEILLATGLRRCAVAGGDTSGNVLRQLAAHALTFLIPLGAATPLCRMSSNNPAFDGLQISLKGGQLGEHDFYERLLEGRMPE